MESAQHAKRVSAACELLCEQNLVPIMVHAVLLMEQRCCACCMHAWAVHACTGGTHLEVRGKEERDVGEHEAVRRLHVHNEPQLAQDLLLRTD